MKSRLISIPLIVFAATVVLAIIASVIYEVKNIGFFSPSWGYFYLLYATLGTIGTLSLMVLLVGIVIKIVQKVRSRAA